MGLDLRQDSASYGQWHAVQLRPERANALLTYEGCGHGFQVLEPGRELLYLHLVGWVPEAETAVCWDDLQLAIDWPSLVTEMRDRERALPSLNQFKINCMQSA